MPNPEGVNGFQGFAPEPAYGEKIQQRALEQAAPTPQNPALSAPRRDQRKASRGQQPAPPPVAPAAAEPLSPQITLAQTWAEIASIPGASDLVKAYAAKAQARGA
jgi:hypothetical protein